jgi:hypothetical protein
MLKAITLSIRWRIGAREAAAIKCAYAALLHSTSVTFWLPSFQTCLKLARIEHILSVTTL